ncbi:MAG: BREX system P-loop protein BrxC [Caldisericia bacterium]|nr:BREX system P-loop protein BrxC [Caldisericia bacterium]
MKKIKDLLTLDFHQDIKNVIDLEDRSEQEIQQEIESYIVTEGIGRHLNNFINQFTSNIKETGVWISGFYGSGKSYFGKMLGYIIDNPMINGTPARDRFIPRIKGISDESIIENSIRKLESIKGRVVFLDVAKQNTEKGLAFTLFTNFLKNLGFKEGLYGYFEYHLFIDGKYDTFKEIIRELSGKNWNEISQRETAKYMRRAICQLDDQTDKEYEDTQKLYEATIESFSANTFKDELEKYLHTTPDETLVFIFDEASEAIGQKKFSLLDLEGISESLSSISSKVWTIAIAQEKLDDVINNTNVNRSQMTKVTDRFKTKLHLESTEVDVIIRSRLLRKTPQGLKELAEYYHKNEGLVSDATNLKASLPTKTSNEDEFSSYYPFHRYQFDILQNFLFSSNALVANQIAARGMIITTFDVLRKQMQERELFHFTESHAICSEAQTAPTAGLINKYDTAKKILKDRSPMDGEKLLKTIHFLSESEIALPTLENITKSYISDITTYYDIKPCIEKDLTLLVEAKILILSNNNYKITSDLEDRLLEEMQDYDVEFYAKKRFLINYIKNHKLFSQVTSYNEGADNFKFSIHSDQDDELTSPGNKNLKMKVYSVFNISENRQDFIDTVMRETQYQKDLISLIPDNKEFSQIDKLIGEVSRYSYMEEKYSNESDPDKRHIIREFSIIREEKEKQLRVLIEEAYHNASMVYLFDEYRLNANTFCSEIKEVQRKQIKNIFTKRLSTGLSESLVSKIFSFPKEKLNQLFSGDDFRFFDTHGNFIGNHLKVVEEINAKIKNRYIDGRTIESELSDAPWGYSFGTIISTLAVLFRTGCLSVKYNGNIWFSYEQSGIQEAFTNGTKFKSASFKSITTSLSSSKKKQAVQFLMDVDTETCDNRSVDWNINDFDLADSIRQMADHLIGTLTTMEDTVDGFSTLFPTLNEQKRILQGYIGKVTESNYIQKVETLLENRDQFSTTVQTIKRVQKFIKKNLPKVREFKNFIEEVARELKKADRKDNAIEEAYEEFNRLYKQDIVKNFNELQNQVQIVKDRYYDLIKNALDRMSHEYQILSGKVDKEIKILKEYPQELNIQNQKELDKFKRYCSDRIVKEPVLEYSTTCSKCGYSLSDILNYTELVSNKENELLILQSSFIQEVPKSKTDTDGTPDPPSVPKKPRKIPFHLTNKVITVQEYKSLLAEQLDLLIGANSDEEIEIVIES